MKPAVSVAVVAICSADHLRRCLSALMRQEGAPPFEIAVAYDPELREINEVAEVFPAIRFIANFGQRTPLELASRAIQATRGDIVLLTEDHCVPAPDWVRSMMSELRDGRAAVGGVVDIGADATPTDWAFYFVDFFRYADPIADGPSSTLTV